MKINKINRIFEKSLQPVLAALAGEVPKEIGDDEENAKENTERKSDKAKPAHRKEDFDHSSTRTIRSEYTIYLATAEGPAEK